MKIDIISGFLGAGKTTLIKKLVKETYKNEKIVLIENEFGEIGVDSGFLKDAGIEITEMNSGCICCTLVGDFTTALKEVIERYHPDRIIIEPSGVGKLSDVKKAVENLDLSEEIFLNSLTAVVDSKKAKMYIKNFGEFFNDQVKTANTIILSRTQELSSDKLKDCIQMIKTQNDTAVIITTPWEEISAEKMVEAMERPEQFFQSVKNSIAQDKECCCGGDHDHSHAHDEECCCGGDHDNNHSHAHDEECCCGGDHNHDHHHAHDEECSCGGDHHHAHDEECDCGGGHDHAHDEKCNCGGDHDHAHHNDHKHHHHADEVFDSWGIHTAKRFEKHQVETILKQLSEDESNQYGVILRAKGMVQTTLEEWIHFDLVPGEFEIRTGEPDYTGKICVIGTDIDKKGIEGLFGIS